MSFILNSLHLCKNPASFTWQKIPALEYHFYIDTGGTFTDCVYRDPEGRFRFIKVLSSGKLRASVAEVLSKREIVLARGLPVEEDMLGGFRVFANGEDFGEIASYNPETTVLRLKNPLVKEDFIDSTLEITSGEQAPVLAIRMATGTGLGKKIPPLTLRLATTRGTNALLESKGADVVLFLTRGFADLLGIGTQQRSELFSLKVEKEPPLASTVVEVDERINSRGESQITPDLKELQNRLQNINFTDNTVLALSLLNAYTNEAHEKELRAFLKRETGLKPMISTEVSPLANYLNRSRTLSVNAFLSPVIENYIQSIGISLFGSFPNPKQRFYLMTSAGSLCAAQHFKPIDSLLSGPAAGVTAAVDIANCAGYENTVTFDMGGTSTDVSHYDGEIRRKSELKIVGRELQVPAVDIETVAAGGGSICYFEDFALRVGPGSAAADPGPACYGAGGPLTLTDINLLAGRIDPGAFGIPVFPGKAEKKLKEVLSDMEQKTGQPSDRKSVLAGFLQIANETMAGSIKKISVLKGRSLDQSVLVTFGGAGGLHAIDMAELLNMKAVMFPSKGGVLSAVGLSVAKLERSVQKQFFKSLDEMKGHLPNIIHDLEQQAIEKLSEEVPKHSISISRREIFLRYAGQDAVLIIDYKPDLEVENAFHREHQREYGFVMEGRVVELESIRIWASEIPDYDSGGEGKAFNSPSTDSDYLLVSTLGDEKLHEKPDFPIHGPALLTGEFSTIWIKKGWVVSYLEDGHLIAERSENLPRQSMAPGKEQEGLAEEAELELFANRFKNIAENMGAVLERTAISVNVKERLDFSCAICDGLGYLVANAPHVPVHLGSLGTCVRAVIDFMPAGPGDVIVTNHPAFGGSHLPDVTLLKGVFDENGRAVAFLVNRAHHSEIGGTTPGSMPVNAKNLAEEGVVIPPIRLFEGGKARWKKLEDILTNSKWPSRKVAENMADVEAAVSALNKGENEFRQLLSESGMEKVVAYMSKLREESTKLIKTQIEKLQDGLYEIADQLDDGSPLKAAVDIDGSRCSIDFSGTADRHPCNLNATPAIVKSVVMYFLRLILNRDFPLNDGILEAIDIYIPAGMLNPPFHENPENCPAVMGGNVEVSQRLADLLLSATQLMACSQGTMNNVVFGNEKYGYYETIGGGTGAGPEFDGASGVHHHMTNTRITDAEILERRYPVELVEFSIRTHSGGTGKYRGGDGIVRKYRFLEQAQISLLAERRKSRPPGLQGGAYGKAGRQFIERKNGLVIELKGNVNTKVEKGDVLVVETPGGGGFGE